MTLDEARRTVLANGCTIKSEDAMANGLGSRLVLTSGQIVNVYDSGKHSVQGKDSGGRVKQLLDDLAADLAAGKTPGRKVFVVYGHDDQALTQLEAMLRRWQLEPLILRRLPSGGQTVIEKLDHYQSDASFGVVLATPDDQGHAKGDPGSKLFRARQNVVLELGMLLARLGRRNVAILLKNQSDMERPSDIQGLIYHSFSDNVEEAGAALMRELAHAQIPIDPTLL